MNGYLFHVVRYTVHRPLPLPFSSAGPRLRSSASTLVMGSSISFCTRASTCASGSIRKVCATCRAATFAAVAFGERLGSGGIVTGGLRGDAFHRRLQRHQGVHVPLIGRSDVAIHAARRHHGLHRLERIRHLRHVHRGILRCQPEERQQRRLVAGEQAELLRGIRQAGVLDHAGRLQVSAPLLHEIGVVAVRQLLRELGAVDVGRRLFAQHPCFAGEVFLGVLERVLHEIPAGLGEGRRHFVTVDHGLGRTGKLAVEVDRRAGLGGIAQHGLIDALKAGELGQVLARVLDGGGVVIGGERIRDLQLVAVELELLLGQRQPLRVHGRDWRSNDSAAPAPETRGCSCRDWRW